jgi:hypothetical protein
MNDANRPTVPPGTLHEVDPLARHYLGIGCGNGRHDLVAECDPRPIQIGAILR